MITREERERSNTAAFKAKLFGDVLRGTVARMPDDPVDLIPYFRNIERLFSDFKVEPELQAHLLKPHLNDNARALVSRVDPSGAASYNEVKKCFCVNLSSVHLLCWSVSTASCVSGR